MPRRGIRHHRLGRLAALAVGAFLLSWCAVLGATLPAMGEAVLVELPLSAAAIWLAVSLSPVRTSGGAGR